MPNQAPASRIAVRAGSRESRPPNTAVHTSPSSVSSRNRVGSATTSRPSRLTAPARSSSSSSSAAVEKRFMARAAILAKNPLC